MLQGIFLKISTLSKALGKLFPVQHWHQRSADAWTTVVVVVVVVGGVGVGGEGGIVIATVIVTVTAIVTVIAAVIVTATVIVSLIQLFVVAHVVVLERVPRIPPPRYWGVIFSATWIKNDAGGVSSCWGSHIPPFYRHAVVA